MYRHLGCRSASLRYASASFPNRPKLGSNRLAALTRDTETRPGETMSNGILLDGEAKTMIIKEA